MDDNAKNDTHVLEELASFLARDDPRFATRLRRGPQYPWRRARSAAAWGALAALAALLAALPGALTGVVIASATVAMMLVLFIAAVTVALFASEQEARLVLGRSATSR